MPRAKLTEEERKERRRDNVRRWRKNNYIPHPLPKLTDEEKREHKKINRATYRRRNREKIIEKDRERHSRNRDEVNLRRRSVYLDNPEKFRKEKHNWAIANPEKVKICNHNYYMENKDKVKIKVEIWNSNNPEKFKATQKKYKNTAYKRLREDILDAYGNKCVCCGEDTPEFLAIDHIDNTGSEHRKQVGLGGRMYQWLKDNGYPKDNFQLLCCNCNHSKAKDPDHICIHERLRQQSPKSLWSFAV